MSDSMAEARVGQIAVIFISRLASGQAGYNEAAAAMAVLAATQPGYRGVDSARGGDGVGITVSYWADEAAAIAWRGHAEHSVIREAGRDRWYLSYQVLVTRIERGYSWQRR